MCNEEELIKYGKEVIVICIRIHDFLMHSTTVQLIHGIFHESAHISSKTDRIVMKISS